MTKSTAYRIRQKCIDYLELVGLDVARNKVVGEEYRIRYLIALLYYKYGVDFDYFDVSTKTIAREFVLSTNNVMDMHFSHIFSPERVSFHILLLNAQNPDILREEENCVIVVNHSFKNVINNLYLTEENPSHIIVLVSTELTAYDMDSVYHAIKEQDDKNHLLLFSS